LDAQLTGQHRCRWPTADHVCEGFHAAFVMHPVSQVNTFRILELIDTPCYGHNAMDTQAKRLRHARETAGVATGTDAARNLGVNPVTYRAYENGTRPLPWRAAVLYGSAFHVEPIWLFAGQGPMSAGDINREAAQVARELLAERNDTLEDLRRRLDQAEQRLDKAAEERARLTELVAMLLAERQSTS
jgi:DNA-binding XRE family transcriptional regulator